MSDDDNVQYIKKPRNIHYGELEEAATNDESNKKGENSAANPPQVHISTGINSYRNKKLFRKVRLLSKSQLHESKKIWRQGSEETAGTIILMLQLTLVEFLKGH